MTGKGSPAPPPRPHQAPVTGLDQVKWVLLCSAKCAPRANAGVGHLQFAKGKWSQSVHTQRMFQKMQDPFSEEQPPKGPAAPSQCWLLKSRWVLGPPHPGEARTGAPGWLGSERAAPVPSPHPYPKLRTVLGFSRKPEPWPEPTCSSDHPTVPLSKSGCTAHASFLGSPWGSPQHASSQSWSLGAPLVSTENCTQP